MLTSRVTTRGPFFDGRTAHAIDGAVHDFEREFAQHGYNMVQSRLSRVLRNPTGYYQSQIQTERRAAGWEINDGGVVYGPWLEGTGERNRTTRFKGYHTFRLIAQRMNRQAVPFAEKLLARRRVLG